MTHNRVTRRQNYARMLLIIFLMMMSLASLHRHEPLAGEGLCVQCANHQHHSGHLMEGQAGSHDCVLCQFLSLAYTVSQAVSIAAVLFLMGPQLSFYRGGHASRPVLRTLGRSPPLLL